MPRITIKQDDQKQRKGIWDVTMLQAGLKAAGSMAEPQTRPVQIPVSIMEPVTRLQIAIIKTTSHNCADYVFQRVMKDCHDSIDWHDEQLTRLEIWILRTAK